MIWYLKAGELVVHHETGWIEGGWMDGQNSIHKKGKQKVIEWFALLLVSRLQQYSLVVVPVKYLLISSNKSTNPRAMRCSRKKEKKKERKVSIGFFFVLSYLRMICWLTKTTCSQNGHSTPFVSPWPWFQKHQGIYLVIFFSCCFLDFWLHRLCWMKGYKVAIYIHNMRTRGHLDRKMRTKKTWTRLNSEATNWHLTPWRELNAEEKRPKW